MRGKYEPTPRLEWCWHVLEGKEETNMSEAWGLSGNSEQMRGAICFHKPIGSSHSMKGKGFNRLWAPWCVRQNSSLVSFNLHNNGGWHCGPFLRWGGWCSEWRITFAVTQLLNGRVSTKLIPYTFVFIKGVVELYSDLITYNVTYFRNRHKKSVFQSFFLF